MKKLTSTIIATAILLTGNAFAESTTGTAQATLLSTITFVEDQVVDFGSIPSGTGTCTMAASGVLSGMCAGFADGTAGQFTVSGSASQAVDISVGSGTTDTGVTFNPLLTNTGTTSDTGTLDGSGDLVVGVMGSLDLVSAAAGARNMSYTLTVNYQ